MTEFDEYLQLGNKLENENKIIMACAAYIEASRRAAENQKQILDNYINILLNRVNSNNFEKNQELKQQLLEWMYNDKEEYAVTCFDHINNDINGLNWIDVDNAILYYCLRVYQYEKKHSDVSFNIKERNLSELKEWYYSLKFMIRRVETGLYEEADIAEYVKRENISTVAIYYISSTMCFEANRTYGNFVKIFQKYSMQEYEMFFRKLYEQESEQKDSDKMICECDIEKQEKIAFIIAVNEEKIFEEALYYIHRLKIPKNMMIEVIPVRGASSATEAYNKGMKQTDAKYKVYMHQDVMILNPYMIYEIMHIFKNKEIGMIGVAGADKMPENAIWWSDLEGIYCNLYQDRVLYRSYDQSDNFLQDYKIVDVIDGVMMITQYDIPWREDVFNGWHFYDISQSKEFQKRNYKVVVAAQQQTWCLHEQKCNKDFKNDYIKEKEKFFREYMSK